MRKILCTLLAVSIVFGFSACLPSKQTQHSDESQMESEVTSGTTAVDVISLSENYTDYLATGKFQAVADHFSSSLKNKLSTEELMSTWNNTIKKYGKFIKVYKTVKTENVQFTTVVESLQFENDGFQLVFSFNSEGEIEEFYIKAYTILSTLVSNDTFKETAIQIGGDGYLLDGVLTMPENTENPPVAILVQDSDQSDLNETTGTVHNKPLQDIAWGLAEYGIATIRYNKRFYQYPELYSKKSTIQEDVLEDADNAVQYAKNSPLINTDQIIVLGVGLGGMMAPEIAKDTQDVNSIVIMAGSPRKLEDILVDQKERSGAASQQIRQLEEQADQIKVLTGEENTDIFGISSRYWYSLNQIDTPGIAEQLTIPMLIMQGSDDIQVFADTDYKQWELLLHDRENVTFHLYDGLNHLFMESNGKKDATEYDLAGHVASSVIDDIAEFVNNE